MNKLDEDYLKLIENVINNGSEVSDRTGVGTRFLSGAFIKHDMREGFPILTTKKVNYKSSIAETISFLKGHDNYKDFEKEGTKVWNANGEADYWLDNPNHTGEEGYLGRIYGVQWTDWMGEVNQIDNLLKRIKEKPTCRRLIVTAWNPSELDQMALPPCHCFFQVNCDVNTNEMDLDVYIRSNDLALGCPYNLIGYGSLLMIIAKMTGYTPRYLNYHVGNAHVYLNHLEGLSIQLKRSGYNLPKMELKDFDSINDLTKDHFELYKYKHDERIKFKMAV